MKPPVHPNWQNYKKNSKTNNTDQKFGVEGMSVPEIHWGERFKQISKHDLIIWHSVLCYMQNIP
jgi:hypothetical protein